MGEARFEDVRPVPGAVHPAAHHLGGGTLAARDVLPDGPPGGAGRRRAVPGFAAVGGGVRVEGPRHHVGAVRLGGVREEGVGGERGEAGARLVRRW